MVRLATTFCILPVGRSLKFSWDFRLFPSFVLNKNFYCKGLITRENFSSADRVEKSPDHMKCFCPKLKSKVNPGRNFSVACVVLAICIFSRLSIFFSARAEIFSCNYMGFFSLVKRAEIFSRVAQTGVTADSDPPRSISTS